MDAKSKLVEILEKYINNYGNHLEGDSEHLTEAILSELPSLCEVDEDKALQALAEDGIYDFISNKYIYRIIKAISTAGIIKVKEG